MLSAAVTRCMHLPRCLSSTVTCGKTPLPQLEVNLWRFVAMLLLRNKGQ